jgi:hypothetical protein
LRIDTDLVTVDVTVADALGLPVRELRVEDFKLYEDNAERPIAFYNVEKRSGQQRPVAIVFALDVSGSMTVEEMERLQRAMNLFSKRLSDIAFCRDDFRDERQNASEFHQRSAQARTRIRSPAG